MANILNTPRTILRIGLIIIPILVCVQVGLLFFAADSWQDTVINDAMAPIATFLAAAGVAYGAYWSAKVSPQTRLAWTVLEMGTVALCMGDLVRLILEVGFLQSSWPSISDGFYLVAYPLFLLASVLVSTERISLHEFKQLGLDIAIIVLASSLILWELVIAPTFTHGDSNYIRLITAVAYPVGDLTLIWALIMLLLRPVLSQSKKSLWLLFVAATFLVIGDIMATGPLARATFPSSDWLNVFYLVGPLLLMLSGLNQAIETHSPQPVRTHPTTQRWKRLMQIFRIGLPYIWLGGAYLVLILEPGSSSTLQRTGVFVWVAAVITLVVIRQAIVLDENQNLAMALHQLTSDLEKRVKERTIALTRTNMELQQEMKERERMEFVLREREERMAYNAHHDALTGLPNRLFLSSQLAQVIYKAKTQLEYHYALLFLDMDGFKTVNDSLGHLIGDQLLILIANTLLSFTHSGDTVARLGGDEFVILLEDISEGKVASQLAERLLEKLRQPFEIAGHRIYLSASIGIVPDNLNYQEPGELLRDADLAMYQAKALGKARYAFFTRELHQKALGRLELENDLRRAIEKGEFRLKYQPILELETNQITGFEALIRWQHPQQGEILPGEFIPIAESSGLIVPITRWVLLEACLQMSSWQNENSGANGLTISVNLSPKLFTEIELAGMVDGILAETGLAPGCLKLEITEGAIFQESGEAQQILETWQKSGIKIHMDDFGTGYSSLSYLHQFPIDTLKIDRSFVGRIQANGDQGEIVRTIITLARELNMNVIAEGVETEEQLAYLKQLSCPCVQGYFISVPLEPEDAGVLIKKIARTYQRTNLPK